MNKIENDHNTLKEDAKDLWQDWSPENLRAAVAELEAQNISMGEEINKLQLMVDTFKFTIYFNHISNMAVHDLLIDGGLITRETIAEKINNSESRKRSLAEVLDMDFRLFIHKKIDEADPLKQWLFPEAVEKLNAVNW